nr:hypothetical protein [Tanacetum cinerariifolium]
MRRQLTSKLKDGKAYSLFQDTLPGSSLLTGLVILVIECSESDEGSSIEERALLFLEAQDRVKEKAKKFRDA